ncbi:unnamed protein product [Paramecium octaurelia]|uniref:C2 domain-containing protein n=1 Tax=Paramecium octaurelia TaxID=43137 RepID=A0A8S1VE65_PAROT|nr:unnamed protein product [Paramecium octaurelia]
MLNLQTVLRGFEENGLKQEQYFTQDEILHKLDIMAKREFDRGIGEQIFEQCQPIQENLKLFFRLADVSQTLVDASLILSEKIKKAELQLKLISQNKAVCEKQLDETSVYSDTRYLFLTLLCAKNIPLKLKYSNCHIQLTLGVTNQIARPEQQYDRVNPEFNQDFEFQIPPATTSLSLQFYIQTNAAPASLWGQAYLQIQQLDDSAVRDLELQLKDPQGRELGASIEIEAQIVLNKHQYLQTQLQKFEQKIYTLENDLNEYRTDLDVVERPFKIKLFKEQSFKDQKNDIFEQFDQQQMNEMDQQNPNYLQASEHKEQIISALQSEKHLDKCS